MDEYEKRLNQYLAENGMNDGPQDIAKDYAYTKNGLIFQVSTVKLPKMCETAYQGRYEIMVFYVKNGNVIPDDEICLRFFGKKEAVEEHKRLMHFISHAKKWPKFPEYRTREEHRMDRCPFCGSGKYQIVGDGTMGFNVFCRVCGSMGPTGPTKEEACDFWNTRGGKR